MVLSSNACLSPSRLADGSIVNKQYFNKIERRQVSEGYLKDALELLYIIPII